MSSLFRKGKSKEPELKDMAIVISNQDDREELVEVEREVQNTIDAVTKEVEVGQYVYVSLANKQKKCSSHYVGQVVSVDIPDVQISFLS